MENTHPCIVAVGGVVYRCTSHGRVELVLIKKRGGFWSLPKGQLKHDEHPIEGVRREVFEETGLTGTVEAPIRELSYQVVKRGQLYHKVVTYYLFHAERGPLRPDKREGITKVCWFPVRHAIDRIYRDRVREVAYQASTLLTP